MKFETINDLNNNYDTWNLTIIILCIDLKILSKRLRVMYRYFLRLFVILFPFLFYFSPALVRGAA